MTRDSEFLIGAVSLLNEARVVTSYKYALFCALIELSVENVGKVEGGLGSVTTRQVARRVLGSYWQQARIPTGKEHPLRAMSNGGEAIPDKIRAFQGAHGMERTATLFRARTALPSQFEAFEDEVEKTLIKNPIPRLQVGAEFGRPLLYQWHHGPDPAMGPITTYQHERRGMAPKVDYQVAGFDNRIAFLEGVESRLAEYAQLLIPLIRGKWTQFLSKCNEEDFGDLTSFLFEPSRQSVDGARGPLLDLALGTCLYCDGTLRSDWQLDHFLPWSIFQDDGIFNLVPACRGCNLSKSAKFASHEMLEKWGLRNQNCRAQLLAAAKAANLPEDLGRTLALARSSYRQLQLTSLVWAGPKQSARQASPKDIERVLQSLG